MQNKNLWDLPLFDGILFAYCFEYIRLVILLTIFMETINSEGLLNYDSSSVLPSPGLELPIYSTLKPSVAFLGRETSRSRKHLARFWLP